MIGYHRFRRVFNEIDVLGCVKDSADGEAIVFLVDDNRHLVTGCKMVCGSGISGINHTFIISLRHMTAGRAREC